MGDKSIARDAFEPHEMPILCQSYETVLCNRGGGDGCSITSPISFICTEINLQEELFGL